MQLPGILRKSVRLQPVFWCNGLRKWALLFVGSSCIFLAPIRALADGQLKIHESELNSLERKAEQAHEKMQELVLHKRHAHTQAEVYHIGQEMIEVAKGAGEVRKEINVLANHIRYEHPEKAIDFDNLYIKNALKHLDETENKMTMEDTLNRVSGKITQIYQIERKVAISDQTQRGPASVEKTSIFDKPIKLSVE